MHATKLRRGFFDSQEAKDIGDLLEQMVASAAYNTTSTYSADSVHYPDNLIPFLDKHLNYLYAHPKLDARSYVANLRLLTRIR